MSQTSQSSQSSQSDSSDSDDFRKLKIAFFGTSEYSVIVLDELKAAGIKPSLIVTSPDMPKGRKLALTASPAKIWAEREGVPIQQPQSLKLKIDSAISADSRDGRDGETFFEELKRTRWDMFIVAAYGKIIPKDIIELPLHKTLNVHPSLLPKYRGPSPVQGNILANDRDCGVSVILIDELMDHGPVLASEKIVPEPWPPTAIELYDRLWHIGGKLLAKTIPLWMKGRIEPKAQNDDLATYTKKFTKADGEIDLLAGDPYKNFLKIQALSGWPGTYFFKKERRFIIKKAEFKDGSLRILRVLPEGGKEVDY